jgi:HK97 family phage prohead protease
MAMGDPRERRVVLVPDDLRAEVRAEGDGPEKKHIVGHAAVFDAWTTLYESSSYLWREVVRAGAFRNAIAEQQDVRSLFNHDANYVLGRTIAGTLELSEDDTGLLTDTDPPDSQTIRDLVLVPIGRKDVSQMSFAFRVRRSPETKITEAEGVTVIESGGERVTVRREGNRFIEERELLDVDLFDTSPVTFPAYEETQVALRSVGEAREKSLLTRRKARLDRMRMRLGLVDARIKGAK